MNLPVGTYVLSALYTDSFLLVLLQIQSQLSYGQLVLHLIF